MAAELPPFVNAYGLVPKVLQKIKEAETPARFTQDHLAMLGFSGGSARAVLPLLKRIGFLSSEGTPTDLYTSFRNPSQAGRAMAKAIRQGYKSIFALNVRAHELSRQDFEGLVAQVSGLEAGSTNLRAIYHTFEHLKKFANFETPDVSQAIVHQPAPEPVPATPPPPPQENGAASHAQFGMNLGYTINLNLPETDNVAVFNAIFQSLRENLLKR